MEGVRTWKPRGRGAAGRCALILLLAIFHPSTATCGQILAVTLPGGEASEKVFHRRNGKEGFLILLGLGIPDAFRPHAGVKTDSSPGGRRDLLPPAGLFASGSVGQRLTARFGAGFALAGSRAPLPVLRAAFHVAVAF
jgi:hypothetical protein